jgi:hypothetical protein
LPEAVTFHNPYIQDDYPSLIADSLHYITKGLTRNEMPFPADQVKVLPRIYHVLARGKATGSPSLFVTEYGAGRVLINAAHPSPAAIFTFSDTVYVRMITWLAQDISSIAAIAEINPHQFQLYQNYPNPFNPSTVIGFYLPKSTLVDLAIYNLLGQKVKSLFSGTISAGEHRFVWDGRNELGIEMGSGFYIYGLKSAAFSAERKLILVR